MRISRRALLRAGASTGLLAALAACADQVNSTATDKNLGDASSPAEIGPLPAGAIVDQSEPLADETIEQRRLADIGPADNGDRERHR